jgi:hypothetical protein
MERQSPTPGEIPRVGRGCVFGDESVQREGFSIRTVGGDGARFRAANGEAGEE